MPYMWADWRHVPCHVWGPQHFRAGKKIGSGLQMGGLAIPNTSKRGDKISTAPDVGRLATYPLPCGGSPMLQSGGHNQQCPTNGRISYITRATEGVPNTSERGRKLEAAYKWTDWLHKPCYPGGATPRFWTPTTPPTNCRPEAPWGGGGGGA